MFGTQAFQPLCRQAPGLSEATQGDNKLPLIAESDYTREACPV